MQLSPIVCPFLAGAAAAAAASGRRPSRGSAAARLAVRAAPADGGGGGAEACCVAVQKGGDRRDPASQALGTRRHGGTPPVVSSALGVAQCGRSAGCVLCVLWAMSAAVWGGTLCGGKHIIITGGLPPVALASRVSGAQPAPVLDCTASAPCVRVSLDVTVTACNARPGSRGRTRPSG